MIVDTTNVVDDSINPEQVEKDIVENTDSVDSETTATVEETN